MSNGDADVPSQSSHAESSPAAKKPVAKKPAAKKAASTRTTATSSPKKPAAKRPAAKKPAGQGNRARAAAHGAAPSSDVVAPPAIDHTPDLSLGGVDAPVELPPLPPVAVADLVATAPEVPEPPKSDIAHDAAPDVVPAPAAEAPAAETVAPQAPAPEAPAIEVPVVPRKPEAIALQVTGLTKSFGGHRVVDTIDLTVPAGTFYGIVGPNGAGKTTTLSMIAGLLRADSGTITVNGVDARRESRAARKLIGVLPDRLRTFDRLTGKQLLSYFGALRGLSSRTIDQRVADLARAFDLTEALGRVVSDYSAGMTKKIMMAGALIHSPRVLILDEPFESVDPVSATVILDILTAYVNNGGTVVLSSHGMDLVERVCSRLAVIVAGEVLAEGTIEEVRGGVTLEQRFVELSGGVSDAEGLEWLHTYSA